MTTEIALKIIWALCGIITVLHWKFSDAEVTLLDVILCVLIGAIGGAALPVARILQSIKIKG